MRRTLISQAILEILTRHCRPVKRDFVDTYSDDNWHLPRQMQYRMEKHGEVMYKLSLHHLPPIKRVRYHWHADGSSVMDGYNDNDVIKSNIKDSTSNAGLIE